MYSYIKKLQSKSEETRKQILIGSLVVSMSVLVFFWIYSFSLNSSSTNTVASDTTDVKPFAMLGDSIKNAYENISASVGNISFKNTPSTPAEKQVEVIPVEPKITQ